MAHGQGLTRINLIPTHDSLAATTPAGESCFFLGAVGIAVVGDTPQILSTTPIPKETLFIGCCTDYT